MSKRVLSVILITWFCMVTATGQLVAPSIEWQKCLGGSQVDEGYAIQSTTDGGYIVAGHLYQTMEM